MVLIIGSKVYFIYQTVKKFLLDKVSTQLSTKRIWYQSLDLGESHCLMAEICLLSISFSEVQLDHANLCNALLPEDAREMKAVAYCRRYVFLSYSAIYWAEHSRDHKDSKGIKLLSIAWKAATVIQLLVDGEEIMVLHYTLHHLEATRRSCRCYSTKG